MLLVLSEFDCLKTLNAKGVYPDRLYTDFDLFKKAVPMLRDCHIIFIMAGASRFNKRLVTELALNIQKRAEDSNDTGVKSMTFLCDTTYDKVKPYFKYRGALNDVCRYERFNMVEELPNFWDLFKTSPKETVTFYSVVDNGDSSDLIKSYESRWSSEDIIIKKIKIPDVEKLKVGED